MPNTALQRTPSGRRLPAVVAELASVRPPGLFAAGVLPFRIVSVLLFAPPEVAFGLPDRPAPAKLVQIPKSSLASLTRRSSERFLAARLFSLPVSVLARKRRSACIR